MKLDRILATSMLVLGLMAASQSAAFAADDEAAAASAEDSETGVIYRKKTIVNFEDDTIDGDLTRPDGAYVESRKRVRHSNLIRIREDFKEKILDSVSAL